MLVSAQRTEGDIERISVFEQMHSPLEYRWAACWGTYDSGSVCGLGPTPEAAKADLIENYDRPASMTLKSTSDGFSCPKEHVAVSPPLVDPQPYQMSDRALLTECLYLLHSFALEQTGWRGFFRRWYYSDEPLRHDAANLVRRAEFMAKQPECTRLVGEGR